MGINLELKKVTDKELRFIIYDEDRHSLPNLLAKLALRKVGVVYAAYILEHPMVSYPEVIIQTDGSIHPLKVLSEVVEETKKLVEEFLEKFNEALSSASKERI